MNDLTGTDERREWMGLLARASARELDRLWEQSALRLDHDILRAPEIGTAMVRGRAGATGAPFNLGEMTVTRCSVRLVSGAVGHGYVQGRDRTHALRAALIDAGMHGPEAGRLRRDILVPLSEAKQAARRARAARAAATNVDFFTLVRGED